MGLSHLQSLIYTLGLMLRCLRGAGPAERRQAQDYEVEVDCFLGWSAKLVLIFWAHSGKKTTLLLSSSFDFANCIYLLLFLSLTIKKAKNPDNLTPWVHRNSLCVDTKSKYMCICGSQSVSAEK